jgi:hypothetical protein
MMLPLRRSVHRSLRLSAIGVVLDFYRKLVEGSHPCTPSLLSRPHPLILPLEKDGTVLQIQTSNLHISFSSLLSISQTPDFIAKFLLSESITPLGAGPCALRSRATGLCVFGETHCASVSLCLRGSIPSKHNKAPKINTVNPQRSIE